jgi:hypothetical protein
MYRFCQTWKQRIETKLKTIAGEQSPAYYFIMKNQPLIIDGISINPHQTIEATNFDYRITKVEAERLLMQYGDKRPFEIMCKEYGQDNDWIGLTSEDLKEDTQQLHESYQTFEIWYYTETPLNKIKKP